MSSGVVREQNALTTVTLVVPIAIPLSSLLARIGVSTKIITLASTLTLILTAILFAVGGRVTLAVRGVVFYISFLLNCVDGKVATERDDNESRGGDARVLFRHRAVR